MLNNTKLVPILVEQFSLKWQKVIIIGFEWLHYMIRLTKSHHLFIQSEVKPKPNITCSHVFPSFASVTCRSIYCQVLIGSLDCLCPLWLARVVTLVLQNLIENCSWLRNTIFMLKFNAIGHTKDIGVSK